MHQPTERTRFLVPLPCVSLPVSPRTRRLFWTARIPPAALLLSRARPPDGAPRPPFEPRSGRGPPFPIPCDSVPAPAPACPLLHVHPAGCVPRRRRCAASCAASGPLAPCVPPARERCCSPKSGAPAPAPDAPPRQPGAWCPLFPSLPLRSVTSYSAGACLQQLARREMGIAFGVPVGPARAERAGRWWRFPAAKAHAGGDEPQGAAVPVHHLAIG